MSDDIATEQRRADLEGARRDEQHAMCDNCHQRPGVAWLDRQWLCEDCQRIALTLVDAELLPQPRTPLRASRESLRRRGFGGSDAGVLAGVDPFRDLFSLVVEKQGQLDPLPPNERMVLGTFMEHGVLRGYEWKTGRATRFNNIIEIHPVIPRMLATPDAFCLTERRGVDAKVSAPDQNFHWIAGPPAHYVAQCQWYMRFYAYPVWDIARWNGSDLQVYTVEEDLVMQDALLRIADIVWHRYVLTGELPIIGTSDGCARYLQQHYPRNIRELRKASEEEAALLDEYSDVRKVHEEISDRRAQIEARLKLCVGDADGIWTPAAKFTWKATKDSLDCDWEQIALSLLDRLPQEDRRLLIEEHTTKKTGTRRIHFTTKGSKNA